MATVKVTRQILERKSTKYSTKYNEKLLCRVWQFLQNREFPG